MIRSLVTILIGSLLLSACDLQLTRQQADYYAALGNATNLVPVAAEFTHLFPGAEAYFSYYTGDVGLPKLNLETLLFDRYQLSSQIPVTFAPDRRRLKSFGEPEFLLNEIGEVRLVRKKGRWPDGSPSIATNLTEQIQSSRHFGASEWKKIVEAGGDFSAAGISLLTNSPVAGFQDLRKDWQMRMSRQR